MPATTPGRKPHRFHFERRLFKNGLRRIAGVDEAGRGPLAGPVVSAAVVLPCDWIQKSIPRKLKRLNDSKQVLEEERNGFYDLLTQDPEVSWAVGIIEPDVIDSINILQATHRAMRQALAQLADPPDHILVDGLPVALMPAECTAVVGGDGLSYSIAAASIVAKVTRDRLMREYDRQFPGYGFACHKGYATRQHLEAIQLLGPCPIHRMSFAPLRTNPEQMDLL